MKHALKIFLLLFFLAVAKAEKPNVLIFLSDDQGWGDFSLTGNPILKTPHIDSLARDGVFLKHFFVQPVCSPTRAEMLTGRSYPRTGVVGVSQGGERLNADEVTLADHFKAAGYATGAFGKWHNGTQWPYHPNARGFDEFYGFTSGHWGYYFSPQLEHNGEIVKGMGYVIDDFTNRAIDFIEKHKDEPFLCYLPYCTPHSPMQVPEEYWERFKDKAVDQKDQRPESVNHTRAALAMCENIDWNVGRVLKALDRLKIADNTIVIYFNDNGPNGARWNGGLRGTKGSSDEGGVRSPCFVRWPTKFKKGHEVTEITGAIDLLPTLTDLCGVEVKGGKPLDGVSIKPLLMGHRVDWAPRMIFNKWGRGTSVRSETHRLDSKGRLYDMTVDPGQTTDIAKEHPQITADLIAARDQWLKEAQAPKKERPFTVGHAGSKITHLPARDAKHTAGIKRSSRHPNCSYLHSWTQAKDKITWDVEVLKAGTYEVILYYTCRPEDVGCEIQFKSDKSFISTVIKVAHNPPIQGEKENKVYKQESFVKDFKPHSMGRVELSEGKSQFELRALEIPGEQAIEFRLLILKRVK
ncbi:MAG: arylsulfatase [Akkermansiaceae bacterium]